MSRVRRHDPETPIAVATVVWNPWDLVSLKEFCEQDPCFATYNYRQARCAQAFRAAAKKKERAAEQRKAKEKVR